MGENVDFRPAGEIKRRSNGEEVETGPGEVRAALAGEHGVKLFPDRMEMENVGGGVLDLGVGQFFGAPVGGLLLLRYLDPDKLPG